MYEDLILLTQLVIWMVLSFCVIILHNGMPTTKFKEDWSNECILSQQRYEHRIHILQAACGKKTDVHFVLTSVSPLPLYFSGCRVSTRTWSGCGLCRLWPAHSSSSSCLGWSWGYCVGTSSSWCRCEPNRWWRPHSAYSCCLHGAFWDSGAPSRLWCWD